MTMKFHMTEMVLIHVNADYTPKNQMQKLAMKSFKEMDGLLVPSLKFAEDLLDGVLKRAELDCTSRCKPLEWDPQSVHWVDDHLKRKRIYSLVDIKLIPVSSLNLPI